MFLRECLWGQSSHYATLSKGDVIQLDTGVEIFELQVLETKPSNDGVLIIDCDLEVDFAPAAIGGEEMNMGMGAEQVMSPTAVQAAAAAVDVDRRAAARAARAAQMGGGAVVVQPALAKAAPAPAPAPMAPVGAAAPAAAADDAAAMEESRAAVASLLTGHQSRTTAALGTASGMSASVNGDDAELQRAIAASMADAAMAPPTEVDEEEQLAAAIAASLAQHAPGPGPAAKASKVLFTSSVAAREVQAIEEAVALESHNPMMDDDDDDDRVALPSVSALAEPVATDVPEEVAGSGSGSGSDSGASVLEEVVTGVGHSLRPEAPEEEAEPSAEELRRLRMARFG